jgi:hypothetical protein
VAQIYVAIVPLLETNNLELENTSYVRIDVTLPFTRKVHVFDYEADRVSIVHFDSHHFGGITTFESHFVLRESLLLFHVKPQLQSFPDAVDQQVTRDAHETNTDVLNLVGEFKRTRC